MYLDANTMDMPCGGNQMMTKLEPIQEHMECAVSGAVSGSLGTEKALCWGCGRPIEDRYLLRVMGNSWHETCLQCDLCRAPLTRSCFVKDSKLLCKLDYDKLYGARCSSCLQTIPSNELVMRAVGHVFHLHCFVCIACGHPLQRGDQYVVKDGQIFCRLDFEKELAMMHPHGDWCSGYSTKSDDESSLDDNDLDSQKGPKRPRTILTTSQRRKFKASFEINPKPCRKIRESLAQETGLTVRVVQVWFQNQRAKMKKLARKQNGDSKNGDNGKKSGNKKEKKSEEDADKYIKNDDKESLPELTKTPSKSDVTSDYPSEFTTLRSSSPDEKKPFEMFANHAEPMYTELNGGVFPQFGTANVPNDLHTKEVNMSSSQSAVLNPIDKLFSMQDSYFTAS